MGNMQSGCKHHWREDQDEMTCFYCGTVLYWNRDGTGPAWLPPILGDKPTTKKDGRSPGSLGRRRS